MTADYNSVKRAGRALKTPRWSFQLAHERFAAAFFADSAGRGYLAQSPRLQVLLASCQLAVARIRGPVRCLAFALCWVRDVDSVLPFIGTQCVQWACIECIFGLCRHFVCTGNVKKNSPVTVHPLLYADCTASMIHSAKS